MPPLVIHAFLAAEDRYFYSHPGIDPLSMLRAAITDISRIGTNRRPEGASTITQQVAKNFLLTNEVSLERKIKEALIAIKMERVLSKDRILELYLNEIYLGGGAYGVAAAALNDFNKPLDQLDVGEAAYLAALPKAPNNYNPERNPDAARARRDWVIDRMVEAGIHHAAARRGRQGRAHSICAGAIRPRSSMRPTSPRRCGANCCSAMATRRSTRAGFRCARASILRSRRSREQSLRDALVAYDRRHGYRGPVLRSAASGDWKKGLASVPLPPGASDVGWKLAVVLAVPAGAAEIGLADGSSGVIPLDELRWARRVLPDGGMGPVPADPAAALAPGDVVLVEKLPGAPRHEKCSAIWAAPNS